MKIYILKTPRRWTL